MQRHSHKLIQSLLFGIICSGSLGMSIADIVQALPSRPGPPPGPVAEKKGGGVRGCLSSMIAMVPDREVRPGSAARSTGGYTRRERPEFWVDVPYESNEVESFTFRVEEDGQEKPLYASIIKLPVTPGLVKLQIPDTMEGLQVGKRYRWKLTANVLCQIAHGEPKEQTSFVEAWVERYSPDSKLSQQLDAVADPVQKIQIYQSLQEQAWYYDAFALAVQLKQTQPNNAEVQALWNALLKDNGMGAFSEQVIATQPQSSKVQPSSGFAPTRPLRKLVAPRPSNPR